MFRGCRLCLKIFNFLQEYHGRGYDHQYGQEGFLTVFHGSTLNSDMRSVQGMKKYVSLIDFDWDPRGKPGHQQMAFSVWTEESKISSL